MNPLPRCVGGTCEMPTCYLFKHLSRKMVGSICSQRFVNASQHVRLQTSRLSTMGDAGLKTCKNGVSPEQIEHYVTGLL